MLEKIREVTHRVKAKWESGPYFKPLLTDVTLVW